MAIKTLRTTLKTLNPSRVNRVAGAKRLNGNSLYAVMARFERNHPRVCAECLRCGLVGFGDELDHITPLWAGGGNNEANFQWLCVEHHARKTGDEAAKRFSGEI